MGEAARSVDGGGRGGGRWAAANPNCPNAANPFHRCAHYCPVPIPIPSPGTVLNGDAEAGGSGSGRGVPLYVLLRDGKEGKRRTVAGANRVNAPSSSQGDDHGRKVDARCPNAPNPFHECTDHCAAKMQDARRKGAMRKTDTSRTGAAGCSRGEGSETSGGSRRVDARCPNASNPFHECAEYCAARMQDSGRKNTVAEKDANVGVNGKVDPRCPNASNPFHVCAQYCFDRVNQKTQAEGSNSSAFFSVYDLSEHP